MANLRHVARMRTWGKHQSFPSKKKFKSGAFERPRRTK